MLCDKYRMSAHGCLLSIIHRMRRRQLLADEITGMRPDCIHSLLIDIFDLLLAQMEPHPEFRSAQFFKCLIFSLHGHHYSEAV